MHNTRIVTWTCDKEDCGRRNTREIKIDFVLNDDSCDYCERSIHEPILIDLAYRSFPDKKRKRN